MWWRIGHSAWLLLPILSLGCLSAAGFCYVGVRARRPGWWIAGIVYTITANVCFFAGAEVPDESAWSSILAMGVLFTWILSVVHAMIINHDWLRWRAAQHPWYLPQPQTAPWPTPTTPPAPLPPQVQSLLPPPDQYYASPPATSQPPPPYPPHPGQTPYSGAAQPPSVPYSGAVHPTPAPYLGAAQPPPAPYPAMVFQQAATITPGSSLPPPYADSGLPAPATRTPVPSPSSFATSEAAVSPDPVPPVSPAFAEQFGQRNLFDGPSQPSTDDQRVVDGPFDDGLVDVNRAGAEQFATLPGIGLDRATRVVSARLARGGFHSVTEFVEATGLAPHEFVAIRARLTCTSPTIPQQVQDQPFGRIVDV